MFRVHSTAQVDPRLRLAYWSDVVCDAFVQLECEVVEGKPIEGSVASTQVATLCLTKVSASAQRVHRTPAKISQSSEDYFLVSIQTHGRGGLVQDGREAVLTPGDFALYDSTRPYTLFFEADFQQYVLMLPGRLLRTEFPSASNLTASTIDGQRGAGHLMLNLIHTLASDIDTLAPESASAIADSVRQILIAGLSTLPAAKQAPMSQLRLFHLERVKSLVRNRLRDPTLTISSIAAELKMSASTLHRTWGRESCSLGDWIWTQRLDAAYRDICDPSLAGRSISEIAFSWGFNDPAHFSRAFRARFGCTPRELRPHPVAGRREA
ncbi:MULTISPECIES: helix-turn-helix domain-containing protein [unclassified Paraburkholderia]|uniref:AraC-like ligand-binding domain-containing protein n=1 Tax=unclassified Paraburkholderia TaxID=2615204 RepID=UPI002AB68C9A|nr:MULTISPECIES: helix-turn-helix domain-containing protein [unclassified Paraburkholderia]